MSSLWVHSISFPKPNDNNDAAINFTPGSLPGAGSINPRFEGALINANCLAIEKKLKKDDQTVQYTKFRAKNRPIFDFIFALVLFLHKCDT